MLECFGKGEMFERAWSIRKKVFIDEQNVPESIELDAFDEHSWHLLLIDEDIPIATGRLVINDDGNYLIGRVAVLKAYRGQGVGKKIMENLLRKAWSESAQSVEIHAQTHALTFYENLGFKVVGAEYMEAGMPHVTMCIRNPNR